MTHPDYTPQRVADRLQIQDVMHRWCRAVDRLDTQGMLGVFWPGAIDSHGPYIGPVEGLVEWIRERHIPIAVSSHFIGNVMIEFSGDDLALVETYVRTIQQYPPNAKGQLAELTGGESGDESLAMDMFTSSRYLDRMERRDGEWRIAHRTFVSDWSASDPRTDSWDRSPASPRLFGRRDQQDPVYGETNPPRKVAA